MEYLNGNKIFKLSIILKYNWCIYLRKTKNFTTNTDSQKNFLGVAIYSKAGKVFWKGQTLQTQWLTHLSDLKAVFAEPSWVPLGV